MQVFKFGGASVKNAQAIQHIVQLIKSQKDKKLLIIVSAIDKTTNALEQVLNAFLSNRDYQNSLLKVQNFHLQILDALSLNDIELEEYIDSTFEHIANVLSENNLEPDPAYLYDQVICCGELMATRIVAACLNHAGISTDWHDARHTLKTNSHFKAALVDWALTKKQSTSQLLPILNDNIVVTQGFIGSNTEGHTTTLGREGSDFSAAIYATVLGAESVTIWKDVPGVLNADPKLMPDAILFEHLSYKEAAEMTYYGAKVIHPKTIKPLANAHIPLFVKPFLQPRANGTKIFDYMSEHLIPTYIVKEQQQLISFHLKDFSFVHEKNLNIIFQALNDLQISLNVMQNAATSMSICVDRDTQKLQKIMTRLSSEFDIRYNDNLHLITVKNYTEQSILPWQDAKILLEQRTRNNYQIVIKPAHSPAASQEVGS